MPSLKITQTDHGQLYYEIIRKYYVPTEYHRKKLAK